MKIKPLFDKIVLKQEDEENTKSGIILPVSNREKPQIATVVAVGEGGLLDGKNVEMKLNVGDRVLYTKYAGNEFKLDGEEYIIIKQTDILAVIK